MRSPRNWFVVVGLMGLGSLLETPSRANAQAVAYAPQVGTIPDGVSLSALPVVSADRRYVRLSLNPNFQTVDGFQTIGIPFAVSGMNSGQIGGGGAGGAGGIPGLRNVGVAMGMDGPSMPRTAEGGFAMGPQNSLTGMNSFDGGDFPDDSSWTPPRRTRTTRARSARAKISATAQASTTKAAPIKASPNR